MEVYILDSLFRRDQVVDKFESIIWTERFKDIGDFELKLHSTLENRKRFSEGTMLAHNETHRVMTVETVEDETDDEGRKMLTLKGRSIEKILEDRIAAKPDVTKLDGTEKWALTGAPGDIARHVFRDVCVMGYRDPADILPFIYEGRGPLPDDTIGETSDIIAVEIEITTVYEAIKQLCDLYDMGFRLVRNFDASQLYFDIYTGSDRTTGQTALPAVIFSPDLDNLKNTKSLSTIVGYKNIALVISPVGSSIVTAQDIDPTIDGFNRHVLLVTADDITDTDPTVNATKRVQRGKEELAQNRRFLGFDGEISQHSQYKYGIDVNLGDMVEVRNTDGVTNNMQVTEWIFVQDKEGERSYPTLSLNTFITPGSWLAWNFNQTWLDLNADPLTWSQA